MQKNTFRSHFLTDYIKMNSIEFSNEATEVINAGRELYTYYHSMPGANPNASYYDIRLYFQGLNNKGDMNKSSDDETYNTLIYSIKNAMARLGASIIPHIYEYGFLKE